MSKSNSNKAIIITAIAGALAGASFMAYKEIKKRKMEKTDFKVTSLNDKEFLKEAKYQLEVLDDEVKYLADLKDKLIKNIKDELVIKNPNKYAKSVKLLKSHRLVDKLIDLQPLSTSLDKVSKELVAHKNLVRNLHERILRAYIDSDLDTLNEIDVFIVHDISLASLNKEICNKLDLIDNSKSSYEESKKDNKYFIINLTDKEKHN